MEPPGEASRVLCPRTGDSPRTGTCGASGEAPSVLRTPPPPARHLATPFGKRRRFRRAVMGSGTLAVYAASGRLAEGPPDGAFQAPATKASGKARAVGSGICRDLAKGGRLSWWSDAGAHPSLGKEGARGWIMTCATVVYRLHLLW